MQTYTIVDMMKDANGSLPYTDDMAAIGTIDKQLFFVYSKPEHIAKEWGVENHMSSQDQAELFMLNYLALLQANNRELESVFGAALRVRMAREGFTSIQTNVRAIYMDEYERVKDLDTKIMEEFKPTEEMKNVVKFVNTYFFSIVGVVAHVFRVRGHHWKPEYETLYEKTWLSTTIETHLTIPPWKMISRDFLHCFGIRALGDSFQRGITKGEMPYGLRLRADAAPAGTAPIRTTSAALKEMSQATWYAHFYKLFAEQIEAIHEYADQLKKQGTAAHVNAKLYDWNNRGTMIDDKMVIGVIPYVLGWIDTLEKEEPITGQKCLKKRGAGSASIRQTFASLLLNQMRKEKSSDDIVKFFENVATLKQGVMI